MTLLGLLVGTFLGALIGATTGSVAAVIASALLGTVGGVALEVRNVTQGRKARQVLEDKVARLETAISVLQTTVASLQTRPAGGEQPRDRAADDETSPLSVADGVKDEGAARSTPVNLRKDPAPTDTEAHTDEAPTKTPPGPPQTSPLPYGRPSTKRPQPSSAETAAEPSGPETPFVIPPDRNARRTQLLTLLTGGNTLARVGVVVLLIGLAFVVQFAASQGYFPLELRLALVALVGVALTVTGWRLEGARRMYALALQGGGVGVMYLSVFASLQYDLIPSALGFALLVLLAVFSAGLAVIQDSLNLAVLGVLGGFLAPIFAAGEGGSHVVLFSYYLALNVGILIVAWFKAWRPLNLLGFGFTLVLGGVWGGLNYDPALFATTEPFLVLFFSLYLAVAVLYALRQPPQLRGLIDGTLVFGLPLVVFSLQAALVQPYDYGLAWSAFALGATYLTLAWALFRYAPRTLRLLVEAFVAVGLGFVTLTLPFALGISWAGVGWALEGAGLLWVGVRQRRLWLRLSGVALQGLAAATLALRLVLDGVFGASQSSVLALSSVLLALAGLFIAYQLFRTKDSVGEAKLRSWEAALSPLFLVHGLLWWGVAGLTQLSALLADQFVPYALLFFLTLTALACTAVSPRLRWPTLALPPLALLPLMVVALLLTDPLHPSGTYGWALWPFSVASFYWILRRTPQLATGVENTLKGLHAASLWFVTALVGLELAWLGSRLPGGAWAWAGYGLAAAGMTFLVTRLFAQAEVRVSGLAWLEPYRATYTTLGLAPLVALLWLWGVGANLSSGDPAPLPYLPLVNPLDLVQGFGLVGLTTWFLTLRSELAPPYKRPLTWALIGYGVLWSSTAVARTVHHWTGVPYSPAALYASNVLQASLALFWAALALAAMLYATRAQRRTAWLVGAGLLGLVVAKLFLVDLASASTAPRIVSFVGVGALLLLIAYVAPAPPKDSSQGAEGGPETPREKPSP